MIMWSPKLRLLGWGYVLEHLCHRTYGIPPHPLRQLWSLHQVGYSMSVASILGSQVTVWRPNVTKPSQFIMVLYYWHWYTSCLLTNMTQHNTILLKTSSQYLLFVHSLLFISLFTGIHYLLVPDQLCTIPGMYMCVKFCWVFEFFI